ncbi:unnamed protein product [Pleuronectes platessa]|uniref:Uncharacterized protein n=1 Tax=Pleuronectes platessa TaxID=8262 RepID=A0A9N7UP63_PLEPL|nr:unnamed protein product [Pleuronectes platessa]
METEVELSIEKRRTISFVSLLARRLILLRWRDASSPNHAQWLEEIMSCLKLEKEEKLAASLLEGCGLVREEEFVGDLSLYWDDDPQNNETEAPVETDPASVPEPDPVYEDFREEGRPPAAVEISPDYSNVKYNTTQPVTAGDDYSFVTAATSQHNADDSSG